MKKNIIANFVGRFWSIFSNFLFIPLYIRFLGIEGFSVISFSLVITGVMAILDAGLTSTLSKEFASKNNDSITRQKTFVTLETCYLLILVFVIVLFYTFSNFIAYKWLNTKGISPAIVANCLKIIGVGVAFQLLSNFYMGGLLGIEKQVKANIYQIGMGILRNGLVLFPLFFWPNLYLFFAWQTASMIIYALLLRSSVKKSIFTNTSKIVFFHIEASVLKKVWRFAGGVMLISIVSSLNTQMDKLAISKLLPLESLGFYTLAYSLSQGLIILVNPLGTAALPRFTSLFSEKKTREASELYHKIFLLGSILVFSFSANLIINSEAMIWIWTGNHSNAKEAAPFVPYLAFGMVMLSLQILPYDVALANGYTKLFSSIGIISLIVTLPGYWIMTNYYGPVGAAIVWGIVQSILTPTIIYYINKKFLHLKSISQILLKEILLPAIIAFALAAGFAQLNCFNDHRWIMLLRIGFSTLITLAISLLIFMRKDVMLILKTIHK